ncbi:multidrug DMT transporter permease [Burkholderia ubonensis]|uniref:DMT family transporter n=1 Tax=Burkholderia ubonensis TaxID=101571 RepID=UPI000755F2C0|nr:DMT family transporter [Burkholderia ubonensis]KVO33170.1 multidrug DMT transporter permease [Burkholderia ubonensis]KVP26013.1 multidrug DMT transporter permease [Burkholderia ubonensis]KVP68718.1 multidrug DMT transporter permease [Burkholderia ubonensis]KVT86349.1 multidrug DMT transporter permease [Burkholderia ubonensis]KVU29463.1 multidrug DMT transporter permease [Burkholderia ubonensis]
MLTSIVAAAFVALWSTGFIVARAIKPYADPNLFLLARFAGTAVLFGAVALAARAPWPARREWPRHLIAGALLQGVYLGASYWAVAQGLNAGVMALLGALQPLATAVLAVPLFNERLPARGWLGMALGLAGVALVLAPKVAGGVTPPPGAAPAWLVVTVSVLAVGSITAGSLYQKGKLAQSDLRTAVAVQNLGAALVAAVFAGLLHETRWTGAPALWVSLAWGVVFLSGGAVTMLMWMLRRGNAARATSLLFLAPPLAALQGYLLFGETLAAVQLAGFGVALAGVVLARR